MNKKLIVLSLLAITVISGCASKRAPTTYSKVSIPELNAVTVSTLGEKLLTQGTGYHTETLTIEPLDAFYVDFTGGVFYKRQNSDYYESNEKSTVTLNNSYGSPLSRQNYVYFTPKDNEVCTVKTMGVCYDSSEINFVYDPEKIFRIKSNSFQQIIEYNGKSGSTLKFTYREFSSNMARQAYTSDFTMDLLEGNQIGYKGALLEIISATNSRIEYKVIRNFNK